jgi:hypothetical protein
MDKLLLTVLCIGLMAGTAQATPKRLTDAQLERIAAGDGAGNNNGNGNLGNNNGNGNLGNNNGNGNLGDNLGNGSGSGGNVAAIAATPMTAAAPAGNTASTATPSIDAAGIGGISLGDIARLNGVKIDLLDANTFSALSHLPVSQFGAINGQLMLVPFGGALH